MLFFLFSFSLSNPRNERILDQGTTSVLSFRPNTLWKHAANLSFIRGNASQFVFSFNNSTNTFGYSSISGPIGFGLTYQETGNEIWWNTGTSLSLPLSSNFGLGAVWGWHSPTHATEANNPFNTLDVSTTYRLNQHLGFSLGARNLGSIHPLVEPESYAGIGLRILSGRIALGADLIQRQETYSYAGNAIVRPFNGIELRASGDSNQEWSAGLYIQSALGEVGGSYSPENTQISIVSNTPLPKISKAKDGVAFFRLNSSYPYSSSTDIFSIRRETFLSLIQRLHQAALSDDLQAIVLHMKGLGVSITQADEIASELKIAREAGKEVVVYIDGDLGTREYMIACHANKILLHPAAHFNVLGLYVEKMYLRGMFDLIGITPEYIRRSAYKSAPERDLRTQSSPADQEQTKAWMDSIYEHMLTTIATQRNMKNQQVSTLIDQAPHAAFEAQKLGLIDGMHYPDELEDLIDGWYSDPEIIKDYGQPKMSNEWDILPEIAVIYADGAIVSGPSIAPGLLTGGMVGADTIIKQIEKAQKKKSIKALVLRVDSPGGSAFASEEIWRALSIFKSSKKPLIVSMGRVAASGGYYISAPADTIFAEPTTITGSIGVYMGHFHFEKLYDMLGINVESNSRGSNASMFSSSKGWTPAQIAKLEAQTETTYKLFKTRVAEGRALEPAEVEKVAQGRVWSGRDAKKEKLVDEIGGLYQALQHAKFKAGISATTQVNIVPLSGGVSISSPLQMLSTTLQQNKKGILYEDLQQLKALQQTNIWTMQPQIWSIQ